MDLSFLVILSLTNRQNKTLPIFPLYGITQISIVLPSLSLTVGLIYQGEEGEVPPVLKEWAEGNELVGAEEAVILALNTLI